MSPLAAALADITLTDIEGASHRLGDFWKDAPAVIVFLRHYG